MIGMTGIERCCYVLEVKMEPDQGLYLTYVTKNTLNWKIMVCDRLKDYYTLVGLQKFVGSYYVLRKLCGEKILVI